MGNRQERFKAWTEKQPDADPRLFFVMTVGSNIYDRAQTNWYTFGGINDAEFKGNFVLYLQKLYEVQAAKRELTLDDLLEPFVPRWAEGLV